MSFIKNSETQIDWCLDWVPIRSRMPILNSPKIQTANLSKKKQCLNTELQLKENSRKGIFWNTITATSNILSAPGTVQVMCWLEEDEELWTICVLVTFDPRMHRKDIHPRDLAAKAPEKWWLVADDPASYVGFSVTFQVLLLLNFGGLDVEFRSFLKDQVERFCWKSFHRKLGERETHHFNHPKDFGNKPNGLSCDMVGFFLYTSIGGLPPPVTVEFVKVSILAPS